MLGKKLSNLLIGKNLIKILKIKLGIIFLTERNCVMKKNRVLRVKNPIKEHQKAITKRQIINSTIAFIVFMSVPLICFAAGENFFDNFVVELCKWVKKIGALVALIGGIKFAIGWHSNTEEEKVQGLKTVAAGGMVFAIASAPDMFGL